jgi:hypothetical protein
MQSRLKPELQTFIFFCALSAATAHVPNEGRNIGKYPLDESIDRGGGSSEESDINIRIWTNLVF